VGNSGVDWYAFKLPQIALVSCLGSWMIARRKDTPTDGLRTLTMPRSCSARRRPTSTSTFTFTQTLTTDRTTNGTAANNEKQQLKCGLWASVGVTFCLSAMDVWLCVRLWCLCMYVSVSACVCKTQFSMSAAETTNAQPPPTTRHPKPPKTTHYSSSPFTPSWATCLWSRFKFTEFNFVKKKYGSVKANELLNKMAHKLCIV